MAGEVVLVKEEVKPGSLMNDSSGGEPLLWHHHLLQQAPPAPAPPPPPPPAADDCDGGSRVEGNDADGHPLPLHFRKAAALVSQSMSGHHMPPEVVENEDYEKAKRAFLLYNRLSSIRIAVIVALVLLPFFQEPDWLKSKHFEGDLRNYPTSGIWYMSSTLFFLIQVICFIPLTWSTILHYGFMGSKARTNKLLKYKALCLTGFMVGMLQTMAEIFDVEFFGAFHVSSYAHLFVPVIFQRNLRRAFFMALKIIHDFLDIVVLMVLFVLVSAWIATSLFCEYDSYQDISASLLNLFILLTTSNSPDVWAPLYSDNRISFLFFFLYVVVGVFFLMNMMFSVIYSGYKLQMETEIKNRTMAQTRSLQHAFSLLDIPNQDWIDMQTMTNLFLAIFHYRSRMPNDRSQLMKLFLALDKGGDFKISREEFEDVCNVISQEIDVHEDVTSFWKPWKAITSLRCLQFVCHPLFSCMAWALTFIGLVIYFYSTNSVLPSSGWDDFMVLEYGIGFLLVLLDVTRVFAMGWTHYWKKSFNHCNCRLSLLTIFLLVISETIFPLTRNWIYLIFIGRALCLMATIKLFSRWLLMAETLVELLPATLPILNVQYLLCSLFSLLGVEIFGGLISTDNPTLEGTSYSELGLQALNYNDYASSMVTNFCLCVVNNWYIIMDAFVAATGSNWARLYFVSFWVVVVAFTLNACIAFFVEAFVSQMEKLHSLERSKTFAQEQAEKTLRRPRLTSGKKSLSCYDIYADLVQR